MTTGNWLKTNTETLAGKRIAVSGATGGLGSCLCRYLAGLGARLVLVDRNREKSAALREKLTTKFPHAEITLVTADLEEIASVAAAVEQLKGLGVDALILNAGAYAIPRHKCSTGLDNVFQINFLSPYYLAREMRENGVKIVAVSSIAHNYSVTDMADADFSSRTRASLCYGNAKRFLTFALYGLFDGAAGLSVVHPGITLTGITAHYPKWLFAIIKHPMKVIFMPPERACLSILRGLFEDCGRNEWIGPRWCNIWGLPKKRMLKTCKPDEAARICEKAEELCHAVCAAQLEKL